MRLKWLGGKACNSDRSQYIKCTSQHHGSYNYLIYIQGCSLVGCNTVLFGGQVPPSHKEVLCLSSRCKKKQNIGIYLQNSVAPISEHLYLWQLRFQHSVVAAWYSFIVSFWNLFWTAESALVTRSRTGWPTDKHCIYSDRLYSASHDARIEITGRQNVTFPVWWTGTIALEEPASILKVRKSKKYYGVKPS
jgi:hypothetical protein